MALIGVCVTKYIIVEIKLRITADYCAHDRRTRWANDSHPDNRSVNMKSTSPFIDILENRCEGATKNYGPGAEHSMPDSRWAPPSVRPHQRADCRLAGIEGSKIDYLIDLLDIFLPT